MKTSIVYVLVSSEKDLYLEELWVSLYSLRHFHPEETVLLLTDDKTNCRIQSRKELAALISKIIVVDLPKDYNDKLRSREIKTSICNLIDGDFLFIDTDTVISAPLDDIDKLDVKNIAMVPELHNVFKKHSFYEYTYTDVKRIFDVDVSDSPYWFNSGCMLVRNNELSREFFKKWNQNWKHSAFVKNNSSDQRALLATDKTYGYMIECLPDIYNCQVAMSIQYFYDAKIIHFWHMRSSFTANLDYSPFANKEVYKIIKKEGTINSKIANTIINVKRSFRTPSMLVSEEDVYSLFSTFNSVLGRAYKESKAMKVFLDIIIKYTNYYYHLKRKLKK